MMRKLRSMIFVMLIGLIANPWAIGAPASDQSADRSSDLMKAYATINNSRFVDLTHTFGPQTPVWRGFGPATFARAADPETSEPYTITDSGFRAQVFTHVGQYGTHIDPPAHFDKDGKTLDEMGVKQMILPLVVIDMTPILKTEPNHALSVQDIKDWEAEHGRVPAGSFVALRTDMSRDWTDNPKQFKRSPFPGWSLPAIKFLYQERHIVANGHESLDTDATDDLGSEVWLLNHDHWQIEAMTHLDRVPATGSLIVATWPKPRGGLGFPARVFAIVPNGQ